jgi:hypothetical protein
MNSLWLFSTFGISCSELRFDEYHFFNKSFDDATAHR